jgi:hypothetical protein
MCRPSRELTGAKKGSSATREVLGAIYCSPPSAGETKSFDTTLLELVDEEGVPSPQPLIFSTPPASPAEQEPSRTVFAPEVAALEVANKKLLAR